MTEDEVKAIIEKECVLTTKSIPTWTYRIGIALTIATFVGTWLWNYMDFRIPQKSDKLDELLSRAEGFKESRGIAEKSLFSVQFNNIATQLANTMAKPPGTLTSGQLELEILGLQSSISSLKALSESADEFDKDRFFERIKRELLALQLGCECVQAYFEVFRDFEGGRFKSENQLKQTDKKFNALLGNEDAYKQLGILKFPGDIQVSTFIKFAHGSILLRLIEQTMEYEDDQKLTCDRAIRFLKDAANDVPYFERASSNLAVAYVFKYRLEVRPLFLTGTDQNLEREAANETINYAIKALSLPKYEINPRVDPIGVSIRLSNLAEAIALQSILEKSAIKRAEKLYEARQILDTVSKWKTYHPVIQMTSAQVRAIEILMNSEFHTDDELIIFAEKAIQDIQLARDQNYQSRFRDMEHILNSYMELNAIIRFVEPRFKEEVQQMLDGSSDEYETPMRRRNR